MREAFGELRSRCHAAPSEGAWELVCDVIDRCDAPTLVEQVIPYAQANMSGWPAALREAPRRWLDRFTRGEPVPELGLAGAARLGRGHGALLERIGESALRVSELEIWRTLARDEASAQAMSLVSWAGLRHAVSVTILDGEGFGDDAAARLAAREDLGALKSLTLTRPGMTRRGAWSLLDGGADGALAGLERVTLRGLEDAEDAARALAEGPERPALRELGLSGWTRGISSGGALGWRGLCALTEESRRWPGLAKLEARGALTGARAGETRPDLTKLSRLEALDLGHTIQLGAEGWEELTARGLPATLSALDVSWSALSLARVARTLEGSGVTSLDVSNTPVDLDGMDELRSRGVLGRLSALTMRMSSARGSTDEALRSLARADALGLEALCLGGVRLADEGVRALARAPLGGLRRLDVPRSGLGERARELAGARWGRLEAMRVPGNDLGGDELEVWSRAEWFRALEELSWSSNRVSARGLDAALAGWEGGRLKRLDLSECDLTDEDARRLAGSEALGGLEELDVSRNGRITAEGIAALASSQWLPEHVRSRFARAGVGVSRRS